MTRPQHIMAGEARDGIEAFRAAEEALRHRQARSALQMFKRAEISGHDADACAAGRWTSNMLLGDFEAAWRESDMIARRAFPDPNRFWNGRPFAGQRVLLRCLHGLGDTIQFIRYAPLISREARSLTIEAQPALKPLIECCGLADHVITWRQPEPEWDQQVEVMELPRIFRTTVDSIPAAIPYLRLPSSAGAKNRELLRVAIVWASGAFNPSRSIPLRTLSRICDRPDVAFFSIQGGPEREELRECRTRICDLDDESCTVLGAARTLMGMDLLISVDTMMAHLAGALGRRVWTLLPYEADWRWMLNRCDSPWYPNMRLFRQPRPTDWESVAAEVQAALQDLVVCEDRLTPVADREA